VESDYDENNNTAYILVYGEESRNNIVPISNCSVILRENSYVYDGTEKKPLVTVKYQGRILLKIK